MTLFMTRSSDVVITIAEAHRHQVSAPWKKVVGHLEHHI